MVAKAHSPIPQRIGRHRGAVASANAGVGCDGDEACDEGNIEEDGDKGKENNAAEAAGKEEA
jgi:hypothetical protein